MKMGLILIYVLLFSSTLLEAKSITCKKGKNACGFQFPIFHHKKSIAREVVFGSNTDYQVFWNDTYNQINKLFGATDCGEYFDARKNSAMIGWRHIKSTNNVELTGYVHRKSTNDNGKNYLHAPIGIVERA